MSGKQFAVLALLCLFGASLLVLSCEDTDCKLCDENGLSETEQECADMVRAMFGCSIELSRLDFGDAIDACAGGYENDLAQCYFACYDDFSKCTFWRDCAAGCESDHGRWAEPEATDDDIAIDDDDDVSTDDDDASSPTLCSEAYEFFYFECEYVLTDMEDNEIPVEDLIAWCEDGIAFYSDDLLFCIVDFIPDCDAIADCILDLL